jgi:SAM-dependent methyltransferase
LEYLSDYYENHHRRKEKVGKGFIVIPSRIQYFIDWIGTGKTILDLGCRDGELTQHYLNGNQMTGIDCDRNALTLAKERGIETVYSDLNDCFPLPDKTFDVVVAGEVLEHLFSPPETIKEIARILKPGGLFVGSVPNGYRFKNRRRFLIGRTIDVHPFSEHLHLFAWWHLEQLLAPLFEDIEIVPLEGSVF